MYGNQSYSKKQKIDSEIKEADANYSRNKASLENIENMSVAEIKQKLKELGKLSNAGIKSKLRGNARTVLLKFLSTGLEK